MYGTFLRKRPICVEFEGHPETLRGTQIVQKVPSVSPVNNTSDQIATIQLKVCLLISQLNTHACTHTPQSEHDWVEALCQVILQCDWPRA